VVPADSGVPGLKWLEFDVRNTPELVDDSDSGTSVDEENWTVEVEGSPSRFPLLAKFGIALGMLVMLFIATLALGPIILPASISAPYAERFISQLVGMEIRIKGDHSFRILPSLRLQAMNVVSAGDGDAFNLSLPYLEIEASALGALSGSADIERIVLRDPALNIVTSHEMPADKSLAPEIDHAWGWWRDMSLQELKIDNAAFSISGRETRSLKLEKFNVINAEPGKGQVEDGLVLNGTGVLNGQDIKLSVSTSDPQLLVSGNRWPFNLSFMSALLQGTVNGSMAMRERMVGEGELVFTGSDVEALNDWIGPFLPARGKGALSLKANVELAADVIDVRRMELAFGATSLSGNVTVRDVTSGAPVADGQLDAQTLDMGLVPFGDAMAVAEMPLMISGMPSGKIEVSWQRALWRNIELGIGKATIERPQGTHRLQVMLQDSTVYGGSMRGSFTLDASEGMRALAVEARAVGVDIGPMLTAASKAEVPVLSGKSTLELNLFSVGGTLHELMEALTGKAEVVAQDGELTIAELVGGLVPEAGNVLPFKSLNASFSIAQGIASSEDLLLRSGKMSLVGKGRVDLANWTIDLNVGRLGSEGDAKSLKRYRVSGPAGEMRVEPINGS
jgi:AsmA protein